MKYEKLLRCSYKHRVKDSYIYTADKSNICGLQDFDWRRTSRRTHILAQARLLQVVLAHCVTIDTYV